MNGCYLAAGVGSLLLGIVHSLLGEKLLFRSGPLGAADPVIGQRRRAALWSTWHLATLFGWGLAALFFWMAAADADVAGLGRAIAIFLCACTGFWVFGTRGRHPAWIVFLALAALSYLGSR